jgi:hypothetical protein
MVEKYFDLLREKLFGISIRWMLLLILLLGLMPAAFNAAFFVKEKRASIEITGGR